MFLFLEYVLFTKGYVLMEVGNVAGCGERGAPRAVQVELQECAYLSRTMKPPSPGHSQLRGCPLGGAS
jgi:hypothetical protein